VGFADLILALHGRALAKLTPPATSIARNGLFVGFGNRSDRPVINTEGSADEWLPWYNSDKQQSKRWGSTEDLYMIETLLKNTGQVKTVLAYQKWHNANAPHKTDYADLTEDGEIGTKTRKQLILDYMHREDTTVPDDTAIQVHGCGEFFTLTKDEEHVATSAPDEDEEQRNRRVEVFIFPKEV